MLAIFAACSGQESIEVDVQALWQSERGLDSSLVGKEKVGEDSCSKERNHKSCFSPITRVSAKLGPSPTTAEPQSAAN